MSIATSHPGRKPEPVLRQVLSACRSHIVSIGLFSGAINLLMLAGSLYMLQVYDRVLASRSIPTLVALSLLLLAAYLLQGTLDAIRLRMLARIGAVFDGLVGPKAFAAGQALPLMGATAEQARQPVRDVDQIRGFLSSLGPTALLDLPWMPLFVAGCFLLHPWLGTLALAGGAVIVVIALMTEAAGREAVRAQSMSGHRRQSLLDLSLRGAEAIAALGMRDNVGKRYAEANAEHVRNTVAGADATTGIGAFAKVFRMILQSAVLGLGAYLVIRGELTAGAMIAASIMTSRALAPVETAVAHWKAFVAAKQGIARLDKVLAVPAFTGRDVMALPAPQRDIVTIDLAVAAPGRREAIVQGVGLTLTAGQGLGVIGPSASGKSTLARALVGVWPPARGEVRLDGAALDQWDPVQLGRHVGYLPQDVELMDGTVAENIARFDPQADSATVIAAARAAGAHDMILRLEKGYDTRVGEGGASLSGGQRQRIGLARALYRDPFLVVLDEPNSNLDQDGEEALTKAILGVRERGGIVVVVTHRPTAIAGVDRIALMAEGRIKAEGPKEKILQQLMKGAVAPVQRVAS